MLGNNLLIRFIFNISKYKRKKKQTPESYLGNAISISSLRRDISLLVYFRDICYN